MPGLVESAAVNDEALFCSDVELVGVRVEGVRRTEGRPDDLTVAQDAPRLQVCAEAKERFHAWCEGEWEHAQGNFQSRGRLTDERLRA